MFEDSNVKSDILDQSQTKTDRFHSTNSLLNKPVVDFLKKIK